MEDVTHNIRMYDMGQRLAIRLVKDGEQIIEVEYQTDMWEVERASLLKSWSVMPRATLGYQEVWLELQHLA